MAQLIDGKAVAAKVRATVAEQARALKAERGIVPGLAVVRVGDDAASKVYVGHKQKAAAEVGFHSWERHLGGDVSARRLREEIQALNAQAEVHGVLLQLPLPGHLDPDAALEAIAPPKDVDCIHPANVGALYLGRPGPRPCTPAGVMRLLEEIGWSPAGKRAVVVGRSNIVGKPMAALLLAANATVTQCHRHSDVAAEVQRADLLVVAAGVPELVKGAWIKPGAVVIDVGMNRTSQGKLLGDVEFGPAAERAAYITPVPGGVGPMTVAMLMHNTLLAAQRA